MKALNIKFFALLLASLFILAACKTTPAVPPEEQALRGIFAATAAGDADAYLSYLDLSELSSEDQAMIATKLSAMMGEAKAEINALGGIQDIIINEKQFSEDGNTVDMDFTILFGDNSTEESSITLTNIDGNWKFGG